jgi:hypothetical protein
VEKMIMTKHNDPNRNERLQKEFQRKGDLIHTNYSLWSTIITLNGIIIAIATLAPVCKFQIILIVIFCSLSIFLLILNFYTARINLMAKIEKLNAKNRGRDEKHTENNQTNNTKSTITLTEKIWISTCWKETLALILSFGSLIIAILGIINTR